MHESFIFSISEKGVGQFKDVGFVLVMKFLNGLEAP
jgi:hypothetical protein